MSVRAFRLMFASIATTLVAVSVDVWFTICVGAWCALVLVVHGVVFLIRRWRGGGRGGER